MNNGLYNISQSVPTKILAWVVFSGADGSIFDSYGVKSVTRTATGNYTIELNIGVQTTRWSWGGGCRSDSGASRFGFVCQADSDSTNNTIVIRTVGVTVAPAVAAYDPVEVSFHVIGP